MNLQILFSDIFKWKLYDLILIRSVHLKERTDQINV
jgi:hypothetical protein